MNQEPYPKHRLPDLLKAIDSQLADLDAQAIYSLRLDLAVAILVDSMYANKAPEKLLREFNNRTHKIYARFKQAKKKQEQPTIH